MVSTLKKICGCDLASFKDSTYCGEYASPSRSLRLSNDLAIDLGTATTLVYVQGKGIVLNEPSVVAVEKKTERVMAVGADAKRMLGSCLNVLKGTKPVTDHE